MYDLRNLRVVVEVSRHIAEEAHRQADTTAEAHRIAVAEVHRIVGVHQTIRHLAVARAVARHIAVAHRTVAEVEETRVADSSF